MMPYNLHLLDLNFATKAKNPTKHTSEKNKKLKVQRTKQ